MRSSHPSLQRKRPIRILAVDEQPLVREGLAAIINRQEGMGVTAEAANGVDALRIFLEIRPDLVTLDLALPDLTGEELARRMLAANPGARLVAITNERGDVRLLRTLEAGVQGIVRKGASATEMVETIRQVHAGRRKISGDVASILAEHVGDEPLTPREVEVLSEVACGKRNKEIAGSLCIADETVRMHMRNILGKLGAHDRTHAVTIAVGRGIIRL